MIEINNAVLTNLTAFFDADGWPFTPIEGETALRLAFKGASGQWACYARALEEREQFVFYSVCPVSAFEEQRPAMAEFLARANDGLILCNFELDFDDGEIRYKTSIDVEGAELSQALIRQVVYSNVATMDAYLPGVLALLYGDLSPIAAIARVESAMLHDTDLHIITR